MNLKKLEMGKKYKHKYDGLIIMVIGLNKSYITVKELLHEGDQISLIPLWPEFWTDYIEVEQ